MKRIELNLNTKALFSLYHFLILVFAPLSVLNFLFSVFGFINSFELRILVIIALFVYATYSTAKYYMQFLFGYKVDDNKLHIYKEKELYDKVHVSLVSYLYVKPGLDMFLSPIYLKFKNDNDIELPTANLTKLDIILPILSVFYNILFFFLMVLPMLQKKMYVMIDLGQTLSRKMNVQLVNSVPLNINEIWVNFWSWCSLSTMIYFTIHIIKIYLFPGI